MRIFFRPILAFARRITCWLLCLLFNRKPKYEPHRWNEPFQPGVSYGHQFENNCYNYACNRATDSYAQPGYASGNWATVMECRPVTAGAVSDGLVTRPDGVQAAGNCAHTVALVMAPGYDYHWYRLDDNGMWSHKVGPSPAQNTDANNNPISNPETAARGPYTVFCGYFTVDRCRVRIDGPY